jgi:hypothetical protein
MPAPSVGTLWFLREVPYPYIKLLNIYIDLLRSAGENNVRAFKQSRHEHVSAVQDSAILGGHLLEEASYRSVTFDDQKNGRLKDLARKAREALDEIIDIVASELQSIPTEGLTPYYKELAKQLAKKYAPHKESANASEIKDVPADQETPTARGRRSAASAPQPAQEVA